MQVTITIPDRRLSDLLVTAFEGGSSWWVTRVELTKGEPKTSPWYGDAPLIATSTWEATLVDDEGITRTLSYGILKAGLTILADTYPHHFGDILSENDDATTGDVFLQCAVFGDIIYG